MENTLYYGDNLDILRRYVKDETVDLVYLDPPFKSNQDYNVLFAEQSGERAAAQIMAFEDTWHWDEAAARAYEDTIRAGGRTADVMRAFYTFLGGNDMMAYLSMMAPRLVELRRVLKPTGSIYLHCDPTASHYLKLLMDAVFGPQYFRNEIIWKRTNAHNDAGRFGRIHDTILFYSRTEEHKWNPVTISYSPEQMKRYKQDENGRWYTGQDLTASRTNSNSGKFEWRGTMPPDSRGWGYTIEQLEKWWSEGLILTKKDGTPRMDGLKKFLDEMPGKPLQSIWDDIPRIPNTSAERLGYPTQKPEALLERIIKASSNEGDVVLDPFCGCGTAVAVAQKLNRQWIGIDITHLAITLIKKRLRDQFDAQAETTPPIPPREQGGNEESPPVHGGTEGGLLPSWDELPKKVWERARAMRKEPTAGEKKLWSRIRNEQLGAKFRRQHPLGPFIADFYCHEHHLIVEVDGDTHGDPDRMQYDQEREGILRSFGLRIKRYTDTDVLKNTDAVVADLKDYVDALSSSNSLPPLAPPPAGGNIESPPASKGEMSCLPPLTGGQRGVVHGGTEETVSRRLREDERGVSAEEKRRGLSFRVIGEPVALEDARELAEKDKYQFQWWALGLVGARPVEQKKGADQGIDGRLYFIDGKDRHTEQIIFSVKGGHVNAAQVRDLRGVIEREKAAIGVFITLEEPTKPMKKEAADAGFYHSDWLETQHSRLQIITIEELLDGKPLDLPRTAYMSASDATFKKAAKVRRVKKSNENLDLE